MPNHFVAEPVTILYRATENSDSTEGRGHAVDIGIYDNPEAAYEAVKGRGVMGVGDGDIDMALLQHYYDGSVNFRWVRIFGYHSDPHGTGQFDRYGYGWFNGYERLNQTHPSSR